MYRRAVESESDPFITLSLRGGLCDLGFLIRFSLAHG